MIKRIGNKFKKGFGKVKNFFKAIGKTITTPFKKLTWSKRIFKILMIGVGIFLGIGIALTVIVGIATFVLVFGVIFSSGDAITHGTNEMLGRNRRH